MPDADAVVFPQLLGEAYRRVAEFRAIPLPILIVTSAFGTLSMWDWEIIAYLKAEGVATLAPYQPAQTRKLCRALVVKRQLRQTRFLVYQDNPGDGAQASIFKRFYWWEDECTQRMRERFGVTILKRSFRELGARARALPDELAEAAWKRRPVPIEGIAGRPLLSALKLYLAVQQDLEADPSIRAVGINCLNESHCSDTTPCLAWNLLYEDRRLLWGCEADTVSMLTKCILHQALEAPILMTNLYPFLLGDAAFEARAHRAVSGGAGRPGQLPARGALRLPRGRAAVFQHGLDVAEEGAGHRRCQRHRHRRPDSRRRHHPGQAPADLPRPHRRGRGADRLRAIPGVRLPQWRRDPRPGWPPAHASSLLPSRPVADRASPGRPPPGRAGVQPHPAAGLNLETQPP
ncbi:MAG: hypothetical protein M5U12_06870 [Verrucomicrobia bacterium]|nr:hypothetical protein [Verrucomicrobiota bacterium]